MKQINQHLVHGFTYTLPFILLYSVSLAVSNNLWSLGAFPDWVFGLIVPVLTASIAHSISPRTMLVPGLLLGYTMNLTGLGFFGGILGGLCLGYLGAFLLEKVDIKQPNYRIVVRYVLIAVIAFGLSYLVMNVIVSIPIVWLMTTIRSFVETIEPTQTVLLVGVLALFTVVDLGGPFNKVAFTFMLEFYADGLYHITGPVLISAVIPPLSMYVSVLLYRNRIRHPGTSAMRLMLLGGLFGLTESAIPIVLEDPIRRLPSIVIGSVIASTFAAWVGLTNILLLVSVPGALGTNNLLLYLLAHLIGVGIVVAFVGILSKPFPQALEEDDLSK